MPPRGHVLLAVFACAVLGACDDAPPPAGTSGAPTARTADAPKADLVPRDMVAAVPAGKAASGVTVHFALRATPEVDRTLPVDIAIVPRQKIDSLRAHFEPQGGLTLVTGKDLEPARNIDAEKLLTHKLVLTPHQDGLFMVTVIVETEEERGSITRVFYVPVMVNPGGPKSAPVGSPEPAGGPSPS